MQNANNGALSRLKGSKRVYLLKQEEKQNIIKFNKISHIKIKNCYKISGNNGKFKKCSLIGKS